MVFMNLTFGLLSWKFRNNFKVNFYLEAMKARSRNDPADEGINSTCFMET